MYEIDLKGKINSFMKINTILHLIYDLTKAKCPRKYTFMKKIILKGILPL